VVRRGIALAAAAALLGAGLAGCGKERFVDYEPEPAQGGPRPDVTFSATVTPRPDALEIEYRLANSGDAAVVAFTGVPRQGRTDVADPAAVYVTAREDGTVEVAKRTYRVPDGIDLDAPVPMRARILAAGEQVTERLTVALPLTGRRPYVDDVRLPDPVERVVFCVGAARLDTFPPALRDGLPVPAPTQDTTGRYAWFPHPSPQHLFCSDPVALNG
jgi:hypothetical protein